MTRDTWLRMVNAALPGSGLVIMGYLGLGLPLLLATIPLFAVMIATLFLLVGPFAHQVQGWVAIVYLVLSLISVVGGAWHARRRQIDPQRVRALHKEACAQWLTARTPESLAVALVSAQRLVDAAPEEAGSWRFLARIAQDAGVLGLAKRADARADAIELR